MPVKLIIDEPYIRFDRKDEEVWNLLDSQLERKLKIGGMEIGDDGTITAQVGLNIPVGLYYLTFKPASPKERASVEVRVHEDHWLFQAHKRALGPIYLKKRFKWAAPYELSGCPEGQYTRI